MTNVLIWLTNGHLLITAPRKYARKLLYLGFTAKLFQSFFYLFFAAGLYYVLLGNSLFKDSLKDIIISIPNILVGVCLLPLLTRLLSKEYKIRELYDLTFWYMLMSLLIMSLVEFPLMSLFLKFEDFRYLLSLRILTYVYNIYLIISLYYFLVKKIWKLIILFLLSTISSVIIDATSTALKSNWHSANMDIEKNINTGNSYLDGILGMQSNFYYSHLDHISTELMNFDDSLRYSFLGCPF